ncbi:MULTISPECIES: signal peptide peptidase SppA [Rhodomicrobium]|uniref:signal peptide peptidase SppA n=1 Tax=Rhodomicrobium TaxID=1068 RepID=UPI001481FF06|nr:MULTISPECIES: signal peptide peptidase SppA [Rhodomicrobium]
MTLDADSLAERRRLKRRLSFWRIGAIVLAVAAVVGFIISRDKDMLADLSFSPHVARVTVEGFISDNREQRKLIKAVGDSDQVRGVILYVDSPGGTTAGAEALYNSLRRLAEKKPVVAVFGTAATSAAYLAGISADHIVARGNTITGSVGVILQYAEFSELLKNVGIKVEEVRSGPLKAVPSPFTVPDPAGRALVEELVNESRNWFVNIVTDRRKLAEGSLEQVRTGRIYTGRQALEIGLIDEIGDEESALKWLQEKRGVPKDLEVIEKKPESTSSSFFMRSMMQGAASLFGGVFEQAAELIGDATRFNHLDGLISVWHPQNQQ